MTRRIETTVARTPLHLILVGMAVAWFMPTLGLLISSFRTRDAVLSTGWWTVFRNPFLSGQFTLENYRSVLTAQSMGRAFLNSVIITVPGTLLPVLVAALAAYAFAWMDFPLRRTLFIIVVGLLVVPLQMTLIPILRLYNRTHLAGTFPGIWLAHTGYGLPLAVYLLRNFFAEIPRDLFESAFLDGASRWTAFTKIVLPLSVPALASLAIFQFIWVWNDLLVALVYLGGTEKVAPLTVRLSSLVNSLGQNWHLLTAAAFISMALPLVIFLSLQRYFVRGILAGSVKG